MVARICAGIGFTVVSVATIPVVKLASALSAFIVGIGLNVIGFVQNTVQSDLTLEGLRILMFLVPIFGLVLSLPIYLKKYIITAPFYNKIVGEILEARSDEV